MKPRWLLALLLLLLLSCGGAPEPLEGGLEVYRPWEPESLPYLIVEHKSSGEFPEWVSGYLGQGIAGVEAQYPTRYAFVADVSGVNFQALEQWLSTYQTMQDFSALVSARVQARIIKASEGDADGLYGRFFENAVRGVSDAIYPEVRREEDYWLLKQRLPGEDGSPGEDEYAFLILLTIDRGSLERNIRAILEQERRGMSVTRDQNAAISRLMENFFTEGSF